MTDDGLQQKISIKSSISAGATPEALLRRAAIFLEDEDWETADAYCEACLDREPDNAGAYIGKLLAELKVQSLAKLADFPEPFEKNPLYLKSLRFADTSLVDELKAIETENKNRKAIAIETERQRKIAKEKEYRGIAERLLLGPLLEESERASLQTELTALNNLRTVLPELQSVIKKRESTLTVLEQNAQKKQNERNKLGIFAGKEKKRMDEEIRKLEKTIADEKKVIKDTEDECRGFSDTDTLDQRIEKLKKQLQLAEQALTSTISYEDAVRCAKEDGELRVFIKDHYPRLMRILINTGDIIQYGRYKQGKDDEPESPIDWIVLKKTASNLFLISKYALTTRSYHNREMPITWEGSEMRRWLNKEFFNSAFTDEEKKSILHSTVPAHKNPKERTDSGNDTKDYVFLLSIPEAEQLFASDVDRICTVTEYAKNHSCDSRCYFNDHIEWWLRTPGHTQDRAQSVANSGLVAPLLGAVVNRGAMYGVRPAIRIAL